MLWASMLCFKAGSYFSWYLVKQLALYTAIFESNFGMDLDALKHNVPLKHPRSSRNDGVITSHLIFTGLTAFVYRPNSRDRRLKSACVAKLLKCRLRIRCWKKTLYIFCGFHDEVNYEIRNTLASYTKIFFRFEGECARSNVSKRSRGNLLAAALRERRRKKNRKDRVVNGDLRSHASVVNARAGQRRGLLRYETRARVVCPSFGSSADNKNARRGRIPAGNVCMVRAKLLVNNSQGFRGCRR